MNSCASRSNGSTFMRSRNPAKTFFLRRPYLALSLALWAFVCVTYWLHVLRTPGGQKVVIKLHNTEQRLIREALHGILLVPEKLAPPGSADDSEESLEELCERDKCRKCGAATKTGAKTAGAKNQGPAAETAKDDDKEKQKLKDNGGKRGVGGEGEKDSKDAEFSVVRKLGQLELSVQEIWPARRRDWQGDEEIQKVGRLLTGSSGYRKNVHLLRNEKQPARLAKFKNPCFMWSPRDLTECRAGDFEALGLLAKGHKTEILDKEKSRLSCLPYFIVAGMPQSGAADVLNLLRHHPEVTIPQPMQSKWIESVRFDHHCVSFNTYRDFFRATTLQINASVTKNGFHDLVMGELAEDIMWDNQVWPVLPGNEGQLEPRYTNADYLHHVNPDVKVVIILRDPVDRLYDEYKEDAVRLRFKPSAEDFNKRVMWRLDVLRTCLQTEPVRTCVYDGVQESSQQPVRIRSGMYHVFLQDWLRAFPRDHVHVINYDTWHDSMKTELAKLLKFLKISDVSHDDLDEMMKGARRDAGNPGDLGQPAEGEPQQQQQIQQLQQQQKQQQQQQRQQFERAGMLADTSQMLDNFYRPLNKFLATLLEDEAFLWAKDYKRV